MHFNILNMLMLELADLFFSKLTLSSCLQKQHKMRAISFLKYFQFIFILRWPRWTNSDSHHQMWWWLRQSLDLRRPQRAEGKRSLRPRGQAGCTWVKKSSTAGNVPTLLRGSAEWPPKASMHRTCNFMTLQLLLSLSKWIEPVMLKLS